MASDLVDDILKRYPGPVTLYPSRRKWWLLLLISIVFTISGLVIMSEETAGGWFVTIFFGLCAIASAVMLLPGAGSLTLDDDGFEVSSLFVRHRVRWRNASSFIPVQLPLMTGKVVGFHVSNPTSHMMATLSSEISGRNAALPDTYQFHVEELTRLMSEWPKQAGRRKRIFGIWPV